MSQGVLPFKYGEAKKESGLMKVNSDMVAFIQGRNSQKTATLDQDATLVETTKRDALYSYQGYKAYPPLNTWWAEQGLVLHTEFRDGNVPAGYEQLWRVRGSEISGWICFLSSGIRYSSDGSSGA